MSARQKKEARVALSPAAESAVKYYLKQIGGFQGDVIGMNFVYIRNRSTAQSYITNI